MSSPTQDSGCGEDPGGRSRTPRVTAVDVLAHQGSWDELGLVLAPMALLAALLWVANRRAIKLEAQAKAQHDAEHVEGS